MTANKHLSASGWLACCCAYVILCFSCTKELPIHKEAEDLSESSLLSANRVTGSSRLRVAPVDTKATPETAALFLNLKKYSKTNTLFGHQDDTKSGVGWENSFDPAAPDAPYIDDSDVRKVTGSYPAVYGWDLMRIVDFYTGDRKAWETKITRDLTIDAYNRGGVNTYSWHYHNPVAKEGIWWRDAQVEAVKAILPGGSHHEVFKQSLSEVADYAKSLVGADGNLVPVIFRPFHEMNGDWFWWGKGHCTVQDYKALYQFTVKHLRDNLGVHNFIYAWSPDRAFTSEAQYLEYYPGDAYVDVLGMDNYYDLSPGQDPNTAATKMKIVSDCAIRKGKVAAFTETGLDHVSQADWFSQMLTPVMRSKLPEVAYVMLWGNTTDMYWTPYLGHPAEDDFVQFKSDPYYYFADRLPPMYSSN